MRDTDIAAMRAAWRYRGNDRPDFAVEPGPGQESVWDYPRPPALVGYDRRVQVSLGGHLVADTCRAQRLLETASPPTFYLPPDDIDFGALEPVGGTSFCEWKGQARYWDVVGGRRRAARAAWAYPDAGGGAYAAIAGFVAFYPDDLDCRVDGELVQAQAGGFYGGWVTHAIVGPFKGERGTGGW